MAVAKMEVSPQKTLAALVDQFSTGNRDPFMRELARQMAELRPSDSSMRKAYNKNPSKWIDAIVSLAKLAGYTEKTESVNLHVHLRQMSDAELEAEYNRLASIIDGSSVPVIDHQPTDARSTNDQHTNDQHHDHPSSEIPYHDDQHTSDHPQSTDHQHKDQSISIKTKRRAAREKRSLQNRSKGGRRVRS